MGKTKSTKTILKRALLLLLGLTACLALFSCAGLPDEEDDVVSMFMSVIYEFNDPYSVKILGVKYFQGNGYNKQRDNYDYDSMYVAVSAINRYGARTTYYCSVFFGTRNDGTKGYVIYDDSDSSFRCKVNQKDFFYNDKWKEKHPGELSLYSLDLEKINKEIQNRLSK